MASVISCATTTVQGYCITSLGSTAYYFGIVVGNRVIVDLSDTSTGTVWSPTSNYFLGATSTIDGLSNSVKIISQYGVSPASYAAAMCTAKGAGWFLPQWQELKAVFDARGSIAIGNTLSSGVLYWTSTEYDANQAYNYSSMYGLNYAAKTYGGGYVRCFRRD
jgi:hypothetical protein